MSATLPVPRTNVRTRRPAARRPSRRKETAQARAPPGRLHDPRRRRRADRDRHPHGLLSSSAMKAYLRDDDTLSIVGPQIGWAALGLVAMAIDDAGRLPLPAPRVGAGVPRRARAARPRLRPEPERRGRRVRALAEGRAAAGRPPGRVREARDGHLPRPLVREAGDRDQGLLDRHDAVPRHHRPDHRARLPRAGPRHDDGPRPDRADDVLPRRRRTCSTSPGSSGSRSSRWSWPACAATSSSGSGRGSNPWADPLGTGFHTIQGLLALGLGGILGAGLGESRLAGGLFLPNASNDYIFAIIGEEFGLIGGGGRRSACSSSWPTPGSGRAGGARHVRGAAGGRHHRLALHPGVHQHRRGRRAHPRHRHHAAVHQRRRLVAD